MDVKDKVLSWLKSHREELLEFTCELIATPSPNPPGDERAVAKRILEKLHRFDLPDIEVVGRSEKRPNVLCRISGAGKGPRLILNGHTDTKPIGEAVANWNSDPLSPTIKEDKLFGLGATDMKAAVAAIVFAGAALKRSNVPLQGELLLVLNADEENGSAFGAQYLVEEYGLRADAAIVCEPTGIKQPWELLALVSRGICCFKVGVHGTQMHSSISDLFPSVNATVELAKVITQMAENLRFDFPEHPFCPGGPTLNVGVKLQGGVHYGVYPGYAEFGSDLRTVPGMTLEGVKRDIENFLNQLRRKDPGLRVQFTLETTPLDWIPPVEICEEASIVRALAAAARSVLGYQPRIGAYPALTDSTYFSQAGIATIPAFGPGLLPLAHGANEYVPIQSILEAAQIFALTALNFFSDRT